MPRSCRTNREPTALAAGLEQLGTHESPRLAPSAHNLGTIGPTPRLLWCGLLTALPSRLQVSSCAAKGDLRSATRAGRRFKSCVQHRAPGAVCTVRGVNRGLRFVCFVPGRYLLQRFVIEVRSGRKLATVRVGCVGGNLCSVESRMTGTLFSWIRPPCSVC